MSHIYGFLNHQRELLTLSFSLSAAVRLSDHVVSWNCISNKKFQENKYKYA
jgi:hypothetical protein